MANKDVVQLKEGPVGPFHFYWNKQSAVWQVTATSLRALKFFRIGSVGDRTVDGEKRECRIFSNEPRLVKRLSGDLEITRHEMRLPDRKPQNFGTPLSTLAQILGDDENA